MGGVVSLIICVGVKHLLAGEMVSQALSVVCCVLLLSNGYASRDTDDRGSKLHWRERSRLDKESLCKHSFVGRGLLKRNLRGKMHAESKVVREAIWSSGRLYSVL